MKCQANAHNTHTHTTHTHNTTHTHTHTPSSSLLFHPRFARLKTYTPRTPLRNEQIYILIKFNVFAKRIPPFANAYSAIQPEHIYAS